MRTTVCIVGTILAAATGQPLGLSAAEPIDVARQLNEAFVQVAERVSPAVVVINVVEKPSAQTDGEEPDTLPREFRRYFHDSPEERPEKSLGQGSGVVIREDGYILTNGHVVEDAAKIEVRLHDGRTFVATVRGVDPRSDVAVIKIDAKGLPVATFADSTKTRVGEFAIAIGAPFSLDYSVTYGHVSAKSRSNIILGRAGAVMDQDFIQTDANINPGNSGGPLVNIDGDVIGINTLIRGLHSGIGFAIPSSLAREVSDRLISDGRFTRVWLGIEIVGFREDPDFARIFKGVEDGVVVRGIRPDGPAFKSDLKPKDVITAVDGRRVVTPQELRAELRSKKAGQSVTLDVVRNAKPLKVKMNTAEWQDPVATPVRANRTAPAEKEATSLGITTHVLTPELAKRFGVEMAQGVIVMAVEQGTSAARQNIEPGDIITSINQQPIKTPMEFREALKKADLKAGIIIDLISGKTSRFEILKESQP